MKRCPFCAEEIQDAAIVCRFCNRDLTSNASDSFPCPFCNTQIPRGSKLCPSCGDDVSGVNARVGPPAAPAQSSPTRSHTFGWIALVALLLGSFIPAIMAPVFVLVGLGCALVEIQQGGKGFGGTLLALTLLQGWFVVDHFSQLSSTLGLTNPQVIERQTAEKYESTPMGVPTGAEQMISQHCAEEWPNDFRMRSYCEDQQREGISALGRSAPADVANDAFRIIRGKCAGEWPRDFKMRAYCESQQIEGYRNLQGTQNGGTARARCAQQWPDDYKMRVYCENKG